MNEKNRRLNHAGVYELHQVPARMSWGRRLLGAARVLLLATAVLYVLFFTGWRMMLVTPFVDRLWPLALSAVFASWFYLPLAALLLLALLLWDRRTLLVLLIPLFAFGAEYGRQFLPNWQLTLRPDLLAAPTSAAPAASADAAEATLRVMTWNMLYTMDHDGLFQAEVHRLQPDLLALQEVGWSTGRSLADWFEAEYPYQQVINAGSSSSVALLSRYPIVETPPRDTFFMACYCQQITLDVDGMRVTVLNAHPVRPRIGIADRPGLPPLPDGFDTAQQDVLLRLLTERVASIDGPLLVTGDLNTAESQPNFRRLRRYLGDSFAEAGWGMGYTYPSSVVEQRGRSLFPFIRIDHILHSPHWRVDRSWTAPLAGSDHQYVVADLRLR